MEDVHVKLDPKELSVAARASEAFASKDEPVRIRLVYGSPYPYGITEFACGGYGSAFRMSTQDLQETDSYASFTEWFLTAQELKQLFAAFRKETTIRLVASEDENGGEFLRVEADKNSMKMRWEAIDSETSDAAISETIDSGLSSAENRHLRFQISAEIADVLNFLKAAKGKKAEVFFRSDPEGRPSAAQASFPLQGRTDPEEEWVVLPGVSCLRFGGEEETFSANAKNLKAALKAVKTASFSGEGVIQFFADGEHVRISDKENRSEALIFVAAI